VEKFLLRLQQPDHPVSHTVFAPELMVRDTSGGAASNQNSTHP